MNATVELEKFNGPLDLLLGLIEQEELNITEIALSKVTEQFLQYLEKIENKDPEELASFLVVAGKLVYLKSKNLLPYLYEEDEGNNDLTDQLKLYKQFIEASKKIEGIWQDNKQSYGRVEPLVKAEEFVLPGNTGLSELQSAMETLLRRIKPVSPLPEATIDRSVSIKDRIMHIHDVLKQAKSFKFRSLLNNSKNRTDLIISFLAVLELLKNGSVFIDQENSFSDFEIKRI